MSGLDLAFHQRITQQPEQLVADVATAVLVAATGSVVLARAVPALNPLLAYGKVNERKVASNWLVDLTVPKKWFTHFYLWSLLLDTGLLVYGVRGWPVVLMTVQSLRRCYECLWVERPSTARMNITHYIAGMVFYTCEAVAVSASSPMWPIPFLALVLFATASMVQYLAHAHLASLVKYSLPSLSMFRMVACPHYTAEIAIYAALAMIRPSLLTAMSLIWVVANLSVSAEQSRHYYLERFPNQTSRIPKWAIVPASTNTLTSFYTVAEQKQRERARAETAARLNGGSFPAIPQLPVTMPPPAASSQYTDQGSKIEPTKTRNGWFVNRSAEMTPYICLLAKLTQVVYNKYTLAFVVLLGQVLVYGELVLWGLQSAYSSSLSTCEASVRSVNYGPVVPQIVGAAIAAQAVDTVNTVNQQALEAANATVTNQQAQSMAYVDFLAQAYNSVAQSGVSAGYNAATNATQSLHSWVQSTLKGAIDDTDKQIQNLTSALSQLQQSLDSSLFKNTQLGDSANISLSLFQQISSPTDISPNLTTFHSQSDFGFDTIANHSRFSILSLTLPTQIDSVNASVFGTLPGGTSYTTEITCPVANSLADQYTDLQNSVHSIRRNCIAVCLVFALLSMISSGLYEYYHWKRVITQAKALETLGGFQDAVDTMCQAEKPLTRLVGDEVSRLIATSYPVRVHTLWTVNYVLSANSLAMLSLGVFLLLTYIMQISILGPINAVKNPVFSSGAIVTNTTMSDWGVQVNSVLSGIENTTNSQLSDYYSTAQSHMYAALIDCSSQMSNNLYKQLGVLNLANVTVNKTNLPGTLYSTVSIPRVNTTALAVPAGGGPQVSSNSDTSLLDMAQAFGSYNKVFMQVGVSLVCGWIAIVLFTALTMYLKLKFFG